MATKQFAIKRIEGLRESNRRVVVFLCCPTDGQIDAEFHYRRLNRKGERELLSRFDYWIDGGTADKYFHGWPNDANYTKCFVFKRQRHRFYGFLFHPLFSNPRFQVCVLVSHAMKRERETDRGELDLLNSMLNDRNVHAAIMKEFPETKKGTGRWLN